MVIPKEFPPDLNSMTKAQVKDYLELLKCEIQQKIELYIKMLERLETHYKVKL
jgi:hypothetical protein